MPQILTPIFSSGGIVTIGGYLACTAVAFVCGIIVALAASFKSDNSKSLITAIILLPPIVESVIILVNNNIATGVAVLGAFSLVRFRSTPGKAKDIVSIFLAMTAGLACAGGYITVALLFVTVISAAMIVLNLLRIGSERSLDLRITVPESLNFTGAFDDLFSAYTSSHRLISVKTSNMGSLYKLQYRVEFKDRGKIREFIDQARCRNGNLEISVCESTERSDEL